MTRCGRAWGHHRKSHSSILPRRLIQRDVHNKRPPEGGLSANRKMGVQAYAAATLRRRQAISPPSAITIPGSPAPTIGPGTAAVLTTIFTSATGVLVSREKSAKSNLYVPTKLGSNPPMADDKNGKP